MEVIAPDTAGLSVMVFPLPENVAFTFVSAYHFDAVRTPH
jgi:hypothetical protein